MPKAYLYCGGFLTDGRHIMANTQPRYSREEFARRGQEAFDRDIRSRLKANDEGKFVAIDIESSAYEIDADDFTATERLMIRFPDAQIWLIRIGQRAAYRVGARSAPGGIQ